MPAEASDALQEKSGEEKAPEKSRRRRTEHEDGLTVAERKLQLAQYGRGMWGCRLIHIALTLQAVSLLVVVAFLTRNAFSGPTAGLIVLAGLLGLANWVLGPIGLGLCLAGKPVPGLNSFGIATAVAMLLHGVLLLALMLQGTDRTALLGIDLGGGGQAWGHLPTKLDGLTIYLTTLAYPDERLIPRASLALTFLAGVAEMVRLVLLLVTLTYVARAAGDEDLVHRFVRAAGVGSIGPAALALGMFLLVAAMTETGATDRQMGAIVVNVFVMGVYAILAGMLFPAIVAARDAADACEFPFQAKKLNIGGG